MPNLSGNPAIFDFNPLESSTAQLHPLGALAATDDGRRYKYALAGGTDLVAGTLQQTPAELTNHANMAVGAAVAIGGTSVSVTPGATAGAANLYSEGYFFVNDVTGEGLYYKVGSHAAITSSVAFTVNLVDAIKVALTTSSEATLITNPYKNTVIYPTTATGACVGVAPWAVDDADYYWCQVGGVASVLCDGNWTVGSRLSPSNATAGAAENGVEAQGFIGTALTTGRTTEEMPVLLTIG